MHLRDMNVVRNKVVLLYALKKFGFEVSEDQLMEMCLKLKFMNYYEFRLFLDELRDVEHVNEIKRVHGVFYTLTIAGENAIDSHLKELPEVNRKKIEDYCREHSERLQKESCVMAEYFKISEAQYRVILRIIENGITSFELSFLATTKEEAAKLALRWRQNSYDIYPEIFEAFYKFQLEKS